MDRQQYVEDEQSAEGEEVLDEYMGTEEQIPAPPPVNPSMLPVIPAERMQQAGQFAGSGLAKIGDYLESGPAPRTSTLEANGDDLSDLFEGPQEDDLDVQIDDLVEVEPEDVFGDGGEDMSDLTTVPDDLFDLSPIDDLPRNYRGTSNLTRRVVRGSASPAGMIGTY